MPKESVQQHVQSQFDNVASNYRTSVVHASGEDLRLMVEKMPVHADAVVLDAGCGAGHTALAFAPHVREVIAYDFTASMLEQVAQLAHERAITNVTTREGDVEQLPFSDDTFDIIATRYSAHHWLHPEQALVEFRRALKPDGRFIISDIMAGENYAQDTFLQTIELLRDPSHVRDYRISEWVRMMTSQSFSAEVIYTFDLSLHFDTWVKRMATPHQNVEMLRELFNGASDDIKQAFGIPSHVDSNDFTFTIPGAVISGQ